MTIQEAFDSAYIPEPNTGCWLWTSTISGREGYGVLYDPSKRKTLSAHRVAWELHRGPIPAGLVIDHVCRVRSCVNPDHLRVVTVRQNVLENSASVTATNASKTNCARCGGALTVQPSRGRSDRGCRRCRIATSHAHRRVERSGRSWAALTVNEKRQELATSLAGMIGDASAPDPSDDRFCAPAPNHRHRADFIEGHLTGQCRFCHEFVRRVGRKSSSWFLWRAALRGGASAGPPEGTTP